MSQFLHPAVICATHSAPIPGTRIGIKQTLIPLQKVAEPIRIGGETCIPPCDWWSVGAENRVVSGTPDRECDYVMSLDLIGVTQGVSVSPLMCAA